jgi:nicotinate-nucleotide--dimethylbenzimidazole phosphoribosyltransferase
MSNWMSATLAELPSCDAYAADAVADRAAHVLRPSGALARLDEVAVWVASWQRSTAPRIVRPHCLVFGADHGVAAAGVSAYPAAVTVAMKQAIDSGRATINALGRAAGVPVALVDVGIDDPTADFRHAPAIDADRADRIIETAIAAVDALGTDLLVIGELGIGNTTAAAAVCAALFGGPADMWVGRGTGVDDDGLARKCAAVEAATERVGALDDPLDALCQVGGAELLAMAAAILRARQRSIPVVVDGYVATAALAPLHVARPGSLDHCLIAHASAEVGHHRLLERLEKRPLLDLEMRLGEASGAMVAVPIIRMACAAVVEVPTFGEWFG